MTELSAKLNIVKTTGFEIEPPLCIYYQRYTLSNTDCSLNTNELRLRLVLSVHLAYTVFDATGCWQWLAQLQPPILQRKKAL